MIRRHANGLRFYQFEGLPPDRVQHAVFTRLGGVSKEPYASLNLSLSVPDDPPAVVENRQRFYDAMGLDPRAAVRTVQVHGAHVAAVGPDDVANTQPATDGLVTATHDMPLVMAFADCVPIMLHDPERRAVGLVHSGWRGLVSGVCQAAVATMVDTFGCRPADICALIGPSIGPCCYEVGSDVVDLVGAAFPDLVGLLCPGKTDRIYLDQWAANEAALRLAGVDRVVQGKMCTACRVEEFYSHRAEGGRTGRFGAIIMLRSQRANR